MFRRGRSSWRFAIDVNERLHAALFVRDALDLPVSGGQGIPPRLEGHVPHLAGQVPADARAEAAEAWPAWWETLVGMERSRDSPTRDSEREHLTHFAEVVDPPAWASLEDRPGLRSAVQGAFEQGGRWADVAVKPLKHPKPERPVFVWDWVRDVAERVARDHRVGVGAVRGSAQVLVVAGRWWALHQPGAVVCSAAAAQDETTAREILRLTFGSALMGDQSRP